MAAPIRLSVPGALRYRALAVRVIAEAARLVSQSVRVDPDDTLANDVRDPFDMAVVSAFAEIFNNVVRHAYEHASGTIDIAVTVADHELLIEMNDRGAPFDIEAVAPLPADLDETALPEGGMGIHIARTMLDEMTYVPGPPNQWRLRKTRRS